MESLPTFEKYDAAEFDAWVQAHIASLSKQCKGWWEEDDYARKIALVSERAELVRKQLASGEIELRPMPPHGKMPPYAQELLVYLYPPASAPDTQVGMRHGNGSTPAPHQALSPPRILCPPPPGLTFPRQPGGPGTPPPRMLPPAVAPEPPDAQAEPSLTEVNEKRGPGAPRLTDEQIRQRFGDVFDLERQGMSNQEIARKLKVNERTVRRRRVQYCELVLKRMIL